MRGLTRRWTLPDVSPPPASLRGPDLPPLLLRLLAARGFEDREEVERFLHPSLSQLPDPGMLPGTAEAADRLLAAVRQGEPIVIYGDYDVDGITATVILYRVIKAVAPDADVRTYIPHRLDEGYGLNESALRQLAAEGARVVVTVDCGITAVEPVRAARRVGLDVIVTDHHKPSASLPDAIVVHPGLPGSEYPCPHLCGAGVAFTLAWRFLTRWCNAPRVDRPLQQLLLDLLPLVALGTIADVVPLAGENRIFAAMGLRLIKASPLAGLQSLIRAAGLQEEHIDSERVGFVLGPRLNACGRMGHASDAVRLFITDDPEEADTIARQLTRLNDKRRRTERAIVETASEMAQAANMTGDERRAIVLAHEDWHPGVLGIVCSRLVDLHGRPTILMQQQGDVCKGSARSIDGYSIHAALEASCSHLLTFGGHDAAAGLSLATHQLPAFVDAMTEHANRHITPDRLVPSVAVDCDATLDELDHVSVRWIHQLSPFGRANRRPVVRVTDAVVAEPTRPLGAGGRHLDVRIRQDGSRGRRVLRGIWWGGADHAPLLAPGSRIDLLIEPKLNEFRGRTSVEGVVRDIRVTTPAHASVT